MHYKHITFQNLLDFTCQEKVVLSRGLMFRVMLLGASATSKE
jgi:hypothetical protein